MSHECTLLSTSGQDDWVEVGLQYSRPSGQRRGICAVLPCLSIPHSSLDVGRRTSDLIGFLIELLHLGPNQT